MVSSPSFRHTTIVLSAPDGLFAPTSTDQRKYWGFQLFQRHVREIPTDEIPSLLSKNQNRCLVNQLANPTRTLHAIAGKSQAAILARAKKDPSAIVLIITTIIQTHGYTQFDASTKTKTVEKLLALAEPNSLQQIGNVLKEIIVDPGTTDEREAHRIRQTTADQLVSLVRSLALSEKGQEIPQPRGQDDEASQQSRKFIDNVFEVFAMGAYSDDSPEHQRQASIPFSVQSKEMFRSRITSCLTHLIEKDSSPVYHPFQLVQAIRKTIGSTNPKFQGYAPKAVSRAFTLMHAIESDGLQTDQVEIFQAFELLNLITIIQVYNGESDAVGILEDLQQIYEDLRGYDEEPHADQSKVAAALIEMMLSFIAKPSLLYRRLAQQVFPSVAKGMDAKGMASLIRVLEARENANGQQDLFDRNPEVDSEDDVQMDDFDISDGEVASEEPASDGNEAVSENDDHDSASDDENDEAAVLEAKLAQALGTHRADEDFNAADEPPDEDMNDEQMQQLDVHLSSIFRERKKTKSKKRENKDARETVVLFKNRVIELLEIFVKQNPRSALALDMIDPLLHLIQKSTSKETKDKAYNLLRELMRLYKLDVQAVKQEAKVLEQSKTLLADVHQHATQEGSNAFRSACSSASLYLVKVMLANGGTMQDAWQRYAETGTRFVTDPKCSIKSQFFTDWMNWCVSARQAYEKAAKS